MLNYFSSHLKNILQRAGYLAFAEKEKKIKPEHLLSALFLEEKSVAVNFLKNQSVKDKRSSPVYADRPACVNLPTQANVDEQTNPTTPEQTDTDESSLSNKNYSNKSQNAENKMLLNNNFLNYPLNKESFFLLRKAGTIAFQYKHFFIGSEHLLYAFLSQEKKELFFSNKSFQSLSLKSDDLEEMKKNLERILEDQTKFYQFLKIVGETKEEKRKSILDFFCRDLTSNEIINTLDPVICRDKEIERMIFILSRRIKNNPLLIGEAGVGKTAIVEGLAQKIFKGEVPSFLLEKKILSLDLALLVSEIGIKGEFEARIKKLIEEIRQQKNIILFIDEIHNIIGAGAIPGLLDLANILKPVLSRGEIQCIGATTFSEYKKFFEKDEALERRFQKIIIGEPSLEETKKILLGLKEKYEKHHHLTIIPEAIEAACLFSSKYLQDRFLPDKAIDLIDEAAAKVSLEKLPSSFAKIIKETETLIAQTKNEKEKALLKEDFIQATKLQQIEKKLFLSLIKHKEAESNFLKSFQDKIIVGEKDIAETVSRITKIPLFDLIEEKKKIVDLEKNLEKEVIGQEEAIKEIASIVKRFYSGIKDPKRPIGSFIFLGPSGVGKTYLAQVLAKHLFNSSNIIRLDMSEFSESFNVSRLIGAPPGYIGFSEGGKLTEAVKRNPYSLILLDEIEKAHPEVFNLLLQILEDGVLTDAAGKKVDFKNTLIIMTSNIGLEELNKEAQFGFQTEKEENFEKKYQKTKDKILEELNLFFKPEFLNRIEKVLIFNPLNKKEIEKVLDLQIEELKQRVALQKIYLEVDKKMKKKILEEGFDPKIGCRNLRKAIENLIEAPLSEKILKEEIKKGNKIKIIDAEKWEIK